MATKTEDKPEEILTSTAAEEDDGEEGEKILGTVKGIRMTLIAALVIGVVALVIGFIVLILIGIVWNKESNDPVTPTVPTYYWNSSGIGLSSVDSVNLTSYGIQQSFTANLQTLVQVQSWVIQQGGVSLNYPTKPCFNGNQNCASGNNPTYFLWSKVPFATIPDSNPQWSSYSLVETVPIPDSA